MCSEQRKSEIVNRLQAITRMPPKITRNFQFHIFIGILIRVLSHSYFAQHICSNIEKFDLPREYGPILVTHTM